MYERISFLQLSSYCRSTVPKHLDRDGLDSIAIKFSVISNTTKNHTKICGLDERTIRHLKNEKETWPSLRSQKLLLLFLVTGRKIGK